MPGNVREIVKESISRRKVKRRRFLGMAIVILGILIVGGGGYFLQQPIWQVRYVSLEPNIRDYESEIKQVVISELAGRWFYVLPKSSLFVVSKKTLAQKISAGNPQLTLVSVSLEGQTLVIGGEVRHPTALICNLNSDCYYIDQKGVVYEKGPQAAYYVLPIFTADFSDIVLPKKFLVTEEYKTLLANLDRLNQTVANLNLSKSHYRTAFLSGDDVIMNFGVGYASSTAWQLKFTTGVSGASLQKYLETLSEVKSFRDKVGNSQLLLIDLRFKPKVYYKFK